MSAQPPKSDKRILAIFLVVLIDVLGMTIMLPLLPFYSEHFGASAQVVGLLVSSYALCQLISGPILGSLSDRYGRRPILIISQIGTLIGFLILASAQSLTWIFISRVIDGLTAGNLSTAQAYITDVTEPKNRAKALGRISIAFGIGFFIGPALTAFLYHFSYQAPIYAAAALSFTSIMASTFLLPKEPRPEHNKPVAGAPHHAKAGRVGLFAFSQFFNKKALMVLFLEIFLFYFSFSAYMSGFALFAERIFTIGGIALNPKQIGYAFTYFGLLQIIIQGLIIGRLVEKFGERKVAFIGFVSSFIGYGLLSFISDPIMIAITGIFSSFGGGVLRPVLVSQITAEVAPHERGKVIGVNQGLQSIAQIIAPIASTTLISGPFIGAWGLLPALMSLVGAMIAMSYLTKAKSTHA